MSEVDDITLINRCLQGQTEAFEPIVDRYQKAIFNVALRMLNDYEDAQDIAQSVFVKAFENLVSFNPKYKFFSWIYRMAVNESINYLSKRKSIEEIQDNVIARDKTPEQEMLDRDLSDQVQEALMDLNMDSRAVLILKHFEGFSYREISFILEVPEKTVKSRLFSSRQQLKDILLKRGLPTHG
ncbi:sigma-70 family RNA polymerase sigma factor [bacterium]|nr:sigma-70 family RNA polymerase sigma factor [bacterium]